MKIYNWESFKKGWFVGNFDPSIFKTNDFEIAVKRYNAGERETAHYHLLSEEITMIVSGSVSMNSIVYSQNDILWIDKGESSDFIALSDTITCVIKIPCSKNDKYLSKL